MLSETLKDIADSVKEEIESIQKHYSEYILNNSIGNIFLRTLEADPGDEEEFISISFNPIDLKFNDNGEIQAETGTDDTYCLDLYEMLSAAIKEKGGDLKKLARMVINDLHCCSYNLDEEFGVDFWDEKGDAS